MPVSLPELVNTADRWPVPAVSVRRRNVAGWLTDWLKQAERRRAERAIAQYVCDSGIHHMSDAIERDIAFRRTGTR